MNKELNKIIFLTLLLVFVIKLNLFFSGDYHYDQIIIGFTRNFLNLETNYNCYFERMSLM